MKSLLDDLRYGFRLLWASPGYAAVAILTLAIGIAVSLTVFSWVDGLLIHPIPGATDQSRLAVLENAQPSGEYQSTSYRDYLDYRDQMTTVSGLAATAQSAFNLAKSGPGTAAEPQSVRRVWGESVSPNYFDVLGVKPYRGRFFSRAEQSDVKGASPVAVISHALWRSEFNADPSLPGKTVLINRQPVTIAGIAPPEFQGAMSGVSFQIWVPFNMTPLMNLFGANALDDRGARPLTVIARLRDGVSIVQANAEARSIAQRISDAYPRSNRGIGVRIMPFIEAHTGGSQILDRPLRILMAMSLVLLLLVCANVANLQLARSASRLKELNVRLALGAGRLRLIRQQLTESALMAALGGLTSIPMAMWLGPALVYLIPPANLPLRLGEFRMTPTIVAFIFTVCALSAIASGLIPALASTRLNLNEFLKEGGRSGSAGARSHRLQALLVVAEVALAVVAIAGAGLFIKSYSQALAIYPGFDSSGVLAGNLFLQADGLTIDQIIQTSHGLKRQFEETAGVASAAYAQDIPLTYSNAGPWHTIEIDGYQSPSGRLLTVDRAAVSPGYFATLRIPLIEGRDFNTQDSRQSPQVVIVNQTFVKRYFASGQAVGRAITVGGRPSTVVGVVGDTKVFSLHEPPRPYLYRPFGQAFGMGSSLAFLVRAKGDPASIVSSLRTVPARVDARLAAFEAIPMAEYNGAAVMPQKLAASLLSFLALLSLLLSGVGIYGVLACSITERTREIGIRLALGAEPLNVVKMIFRRALILTAIGAVAGIIVAFSSARVASAFLFGVSPADPLAYLGAAVFLALVAAPASYLPARRALQADPMEALRSQ